MSGRDDGRDFGDILAEFERGQAEPAARAPRPGDRVKGPVLSIGEEAVFVEVGGKAEAMVARGELTDADGALEVAVGDEVEGTVAGHDPASGCLVLRVRGGSGSGAAGGEVAAEELVQAQAHGLPVEGTVSEVVKGGLAVQVAGLRAFCPISQLELGFVADAAEYVGRKLAFRVRRVESRGRHLDVVLSRRDLLEEERRERREAALARLEEGAVVRGTVASLTSFGAFVDLGGVEGLLHVSEMAHDRVADPADVVAVGEELEVKVLSVAGEGDERRIALSRRALEASPWSDVATRFREGQMVSGRVVRLEPYGAFVRLAPGLEGLVHVSELSEDRRVAHAREILQLGQDVEVRVLGVDAERRRISLSLAAVARSAESDAVAEYAGRRDDAAGGFGSMADFFATAKKKR